MAETGETKVKHDIVEYLDSLGPDRCWHVWYSNYGGYGKKGVPDRLVCYRGRFIALEVKADATKKPTAWQAREIAAIRKAGGKSIVVHSVAQVQLLIEMVDDEIDFVMEDDHR